VVRRSTRNGIQPRIVALLKEKGARNPRQIVEEIGASYGSVLSNLKKGPFRQNPRAGGKGKSALFWTLVEDEPGIAEAGSEPAGRKPRTAVTG
jgi:hypothetical protein